MTFIYNFNLLVAWLFASQFQFSKIFNLWLHATTLYISPSLLDIMLKLESKEKKKKESYIHHTTAVILGLILHFLKQVTQCVKLNTHCIVGGLENKTMGLVHIAPWYTLYQLQSLVILFLMFYVTSHHSSFCV